MRDNTHWDIDDTATRAGGVGRMLRDAREALGLDLRQVAADTRIRIPYLEAIERGHFVDLPGAAYVPAFLRTYATRVGLDGETVLATYRAAEVEAPPATDMVAFPAVPRGERRTPVAAMLLVSLTLLGGAYVAWHAMTRDQAPVTARIAPVPDRLLPPPPAAIAAPAPVSAPALPLPPAKPPTTAAPAPVQPPVSAPAEAATVAPTLPAATTATAPPANVAPTTGSAIAAPLSPPPVAEPPQTATAPADKNANQRPATVTAPPSRRPVPVSPKVDSWLELRTAEGEVLASTFVRAGETYMVPEGIGYRLTAGGPNR